MGRTINIVHDDKYTDKEMILGKAFFEHNQIYLKKNLNKQEKEATFLHEIFHFILHLLSYNDEKYNEKFVDRVAESLYQVIPQMTGKGNAKKTKT